MRFEKTTIGGVTFYYELDGKQINNLFVVNFTYGSVLTETTDLQFHAEYIEYNTAKDMRIKYKELINYCTTLLFKQVKSGKHNVIS